MNKQMIAMELLGVARELLAIEFDTEDAMKKYLKEHPGADKSLHTVKKTEKPGRPTSPQKGELDLSGIEDSSQKEYIKRTRTNLHEETGRNVSEIRGTEKKMVEWSKANNGKASTLMDSVWKARLKDEPEYIAEYGKTLVDEGGFSRDDVDVQLAWGQSKAKASLSLYKQGVSESGKKLRKSEKESLIRTQEEAVREWDEARKEFDKLVPKTKKAPASERPAGHKKVTPSVKSLSRVKNVMKEHDLDEESDEVHEMMGFKTTLGQRVPEAKEGQYYVRNQKKLKADFLKNMKPSNYDSPEAFKAAQERIKKMPTSDFGKILAALSEEVE